MEELKLLVTMVYEDNYRRCFNEWENSIFHKKGY